jgi:hypothetical protein
MHQGCHTWRVKSFSNITNEVQISPWLERDLHTHDHCLWVDTTSPGIIITHGDGPLPPLLEPIVGFQLSCTMVVKYVKVFMDMVCGVLSIEPPNLTFNVVQGKNHIIENNYWCSYSMLR